MDGRCSLKDQLYNWKITFLLGNRGSNLHSLHFFFFLAFLQESAECKIVSVGLCRTTWSCIPATVMPQTLIRGRAAGWQCAQE